MGKTERTCLMEEKYGIELDLIMSKFNSKIDSIKKTFNSIKNPKLEVKADSKQLEYLKYQIQQTEAKLNELKSIQVISPKFNYGEILKTEASLEKLNSQFERIKEQEEEVGNEGNFCFNSLNKGIGKVISKIKRFTLSLLSIRSAYSLVSKASSAYLSQDTQLANKLQAVWVRFRCNVRANNFKNSKYNDKSSCIY